MSCAGGYRMLSLKNRRYRLLAVAALLAGSLAMNLGWASAASAGHPAYWTIGRHHAGPPVHQLHPQGYAYGWFGATARPQAARQTGYYGLYRQWTSY